MRCLEGSGSIRMFPTVKPPGWPSAPNGSRRTTDIDQIKIPAAMGFSARYVLLLDAKNHLVTVEWRATNTGLPFGWTE